MSLLPSTIFVLLALVALTSLAQAQGRTSRISGPQGYVATHADVPARDRLRGRVPFSAMNGGFAGSSSARDVARTFGY